MYGSAVMMVVSMSTTSRNIDKIGKFFLFFQLVRFQTFDTTILHCARFPVILRAQVCYTYSTHLAYISLNSTKKYVPETETVLVTSANVTPILMEVQSFMSGNVLLMTQFFNIIYTIKMQSVSKNTILSTNDGEKWS